MVSYKNIRLKEVGVEIQIASFTSKNGIHEHHATLQLLKGDEPFRNQYDRLLQAEAYIMQQWEGIQCVARRYFVSDSINQRPFIPETCRTTIVVQQPPLNGCKVCAWLYFIQHIDITHTSDVVTYSHNGYTHLWAMGMKHLLGDSAIQTQYVLNAYDSLLSYYEMNVEEHCMRTWFFVRDVDTHYQGLVEARKKWFEKHGLTQDTHYIASTGIGGGPTYVEALIEMSAYAVKGLAQGQVRYLYAKDYLNPTYEYGVTFERGTCIEYGDRAHVIISGTASINNRGEVEHEGDIVGQTHRMWQNVEALLHEANSSMDQVMHLIVYLRDIADYGTVKNLFATHYPNIPTLITLAPVCRPSWLIEMECIAIAPRENTSYPNF